MSSATLMILGEALDPSVATKLLGMRPSQQWRRGDRKSFKRKDGSVHFFESRYEWSGWKRWSAASERKKVFESLVEHWCRKLAPKKKALARLRAAGAETYLDCCLIGETSAFAIPPSLLMKLVELGLTLRVTFYHHEERPNQSPEPTALLVTPRADARVAPSNAVAHL